MNGFMEEEKSLPKDYKENTIAVYKKHNEEVLEYFKHRPQDLLIMDITKGDEWEKSYVLF